MYTHLISVPELQQLQASDTPLMVLDCSYDLTDPEQANRMFAEVRIAGSVQAHLGRDLSAQNAEQAVNGGRHPLPTRAHFVATMRQLGFNNDMQAVVYDRNGNSVCGRLWWMLKWAGHDAVAVLDGGLSAWQAAGGALDRGAAPNRAAGNFSLGPELRHWITTRDVLERLQQNRLTAIDARPEGRFRGEEDPYDPIWGHIPGALNRPCGANFDANGRFKPADQLKVELERLLAGRETDNIVCHCGSGVSAVPNLIALELAGYPPAPLYAGSWSEWSRTPGLPTASS